MIDLILAFALSVQVLSSFTSIVARAMHYFAIKGKYFAQELWYLSIY